MDRLLEYQCQAVKEEANGAFERDDRTWYPAPIPAQNEPFDFEAGADMPLPDVSDDIPRLEDGTPDISGYFLADAGGGPLEAAGAREDGARVGRGEPGKDTRGSEPDGAAPFAPAPVFVDKPCARLLG